MSEYTGHQMLGIIKGNTGVAGEGITGLRCQEMILESASSAGLGTVSR
jgi:hypothetical protein